MSFPVFRGNLDDGPASLFATRSRHGTIRLFRGLAAWVSTGRKLQIPRSKLQRNFKTQAPSVAVHPRLMPDFFFGVWGLEFGASEAPSAPQCPPVTVYPSFLNSSASSNSICSAASYGIGF